MSIFLIRSFHRFTMVLFLLSLVTSACGMAVRPHHTGDLLLVDDFESQHIAWKTWQTPGNSSASYMDGGFVLVAESPNLDVITTNGYIFEHVSIEVVAGKRAGSDNNHYGLVCRYQDDLNYYGFSVTADGYYGIFRVQDGVYDLLSSKNLEYSDSIRQETSTNIINAVCMQNLLVLNVNQKQLAMVTDDAFTAGQTGLIAGTFSDPQLAIRFDNFTITYP